MCKLWFGLAEIRIYKQHHAHNPNSASSGNAQGEETEQIFVQVILSKPVQVQGSAEYKEVCS